MKDKRPLNERTYFGFCGTSEFLQYPWKQFVDYAVGHAIMSIGEGRFRNEMYSLLQQAGAWALYNEAKREEEAKDKKEA